MRAPAKALAVVVALGLLAAWVATSSAEVVQKGSLRVSFLGTLSPKKLPREGAAPISVAVGGRISTTDGSSPPQLRKVTIAVNRNAHFEPAGLPVCTLSDIQPSSTQGALEACRDSLVGEGSFAAEVKLPQQSPFPSHGKVLAFNGVEDVCSKGSRPQLGSGRLWPSRSRTRATRRHGGSPPTSRSGSSAGGRLPSPIARASKHRRTPGREAEDVRPFVYVDRGRSRSTRRPRADRGRVWPSSARTQGAVLGGAKRKPEDTAMRRVPGASSGGSGSAGRARNAMCQSRPVIFAHVYGTNPLPTSYTLTLSLAPTKGTFGTRLTVALPPVSANVGSVTSIDLNLHRNFSYRGKHHSFLSAGCPAPKGFPGAVFPLAKISFAFAGGRTLSSTLTRHCQAAGR